MRSRAKYGNRKVTLQGQRFDSQREARRWVTLRLLERAGEITDLRRQVAFDLAPSVVINSRRRPPLRYVADFVYRRDGETVVEDAKGAITDTYRIKRHLMMAVHGIDIVES